MVFSRRTSLINTCDSTQPSRPSCAMGAVPSWSKSTSFRPVRPADWPLLGIRWKDQYYFDKVLPFLHRVDPLSGTDVTLSYFAADLTRSLQPSSVRVHMSAIHNLHKKMDLPYPTKASTLLTRVLHGISRSPSTDRTRLPITTPLLRQLCENVTRDENYVHCDRVMLKAAMSLAFHTFLRCGELVTLHRDDVALSRGILLAVRIRQSKTDQSGHGTVLDIGSSSDLSICPVRAMTAYLDQRRDSNPGLFVYGNNTPLRKDSLSSELRKLLPPCGVTNTQNYAVTRSASVPQRQQQWQGSRSG